MEIPAALREQLIGARQGHLVEILATAIPEDAASLGAQITEIDFALIRNLIDRFIGSEYADAVGGSLSPCAAIPLPRTEQEHAARDRARSLGEDALRAGRVAVILLAGGQGTRLGFDGPKGNFPFGAITGRTLFAHHAAKIAALRSRYGCALPWVVLTSPVNDAATRTAFADANWFGLDRDSIEFVVQGTLPAVDAVTGEILRASAGEIARSPDGHGGMLLALARAGTFARLRAEGITTLFTFQVDNPLTRIADPVFLGHHIEADAEMSNLAVRKRTADEPVGVIATRDAATVVVEYSDLPADLASAREGDGHLVLWAGNVATHYIELPFADALTANGFALPYHRALKIVPYVNDAGVRVAPTTPNAIKFETFLFDALPMARATITVEVAREEQFSPIKNADGADSPTTCRRDVNRLYASWLRAAGVEVANGDDGEPVDLEIDPRIALDATDVAVRLAHLAPISTPTVLAPS